LFFFLIFFKKNVFKSIQVPGAWLESRVKKVRNGRYCVGRVLSTGSQWVDRDRLRLVKHVIDVDGEGISLGMTDPRSQSIPVIALPPSMDNGRGILGRIRRNRSRGRRDSRGTPPCNVM
jgi:hypothetical protein